MKPDENKNLDVIKEYYGYSNQKAKDALNILTEDQLSLLNERMEKGGLKNGRNNRSKKGNKP